MLAVDSQAMRPPLQRQQAVFWLALVVILAVSLLAFFSMQRLIAASERVDNSQTLLTEANRFLFEIKDVETGTRGYLLTGDAAHLRRQEQGIASADLTAARLRALSADSQLQRSLDRLFPLAAQRVETSRRLIAERGDPQATSRNLAAGKALMNRIRNQVEAILVTQQERHREERNRLELQAWVTSLALAAGVILSLGAIAWQFSMRGREVQRRTNLEEELRALNLELEDRVQERTGELKHARDLMHVVVENIPDMIFLKEAAPPYRYLLLSAGGEQLLGRERSEVIGPTTSCSRPNRPRCCSTTASRPCGRGCRRCGRTGASPPPPASARWKASPSRSPTAMAPAT